MFCLALGIAIQSFFFPDVRVLDKVNNLQRRGLTLSSNTPSREIASRIAAQKFGKFDRFFKSGVNSGKRK